MSHLLSGLVRRIIMPGRTQKQFLRYYALFFLCLVLLFIPFYYINFSMVSQNYIDIASTLLKTGLTNFEDDLAQIEIISMNTYNDPRFRRFSYIGTEFSIHDYYHTITLVRDFNRYFSATGMIEDCGIVFHNEVILTSKMLHFSGNEFYSRYFFQEDIIDYYHWVTEMTSSTNNIMIPSSLFPQSLFNSLQYSYNAISYVQNFSHIPGRTSFFFATLNSTYILSRLATDEVLLKGRVMMYDPMGRILLDSNPGNINSRDRIISINLTGEKRGIFVTVDIPRQVFADMMAPYRKFAFIFAFVFTAAGVILSIIFTRRSAKPVREIIEEALKHIGYDTSQNIEHSRNNYNYIHSLILQARLNHNILKEKLEQHEESMRKSFFARLPGNTENEEFLKTENTLPFSFSIEFPDTSLFYEYLLHGEEEKSLSFINNLLNELRRHEYTDENDILQIFFLYRRILIKIINDLKLDIEKEAIIPDYNPHEDIDSLFNKMIESIHKICFIVNSQFDKKNTELEQSIIKFVDDNISNSNLYTKMVTSNFKINENRLQSIFRHQTGKSYLEYVESKRMLLAKELLSKTNKAISLITKECGYTTENAFYKAFKRYYGMAPSDLRRS